MASKSSVRTSPDRLRKTTGSQVHEGSSRRPSPTPTNKSSRSDPITPNRLPPSMQNVPPKQVVSDVMDEKKSLHAYQKGYSNGLADKFGSSLLLADDDQVPPGLIVQTNGTRGSLECGSEDEKKISEQGVGSSSAKISDSTGSIAKTSSSAKTSGRAEFVESGKSNICRASTSSDVSDESTCSSFSSVNKPHKAQDMRWEAIQAVRARDGVLGLNHFRLLKRLGCGDIGSVYLSELTGTKCYFAMKVMDKASLASRKKLLRAQTEREILQSLDHPFLPTLYTHFETEKFSCLVMEFCPGGDLHTLRQRQPGKYFTEQAVKFYVADRKSVV